MSCLVLFMIPHRVYISLISKTHHIPVSLFTFCCMSDLFTCLLSVGDYCTQSYLSVMSPIDIYIHSVIEINALVCVYIMSSGGIVHSRCDIQRNAS